MGGGRGAVTVSDWVSHLVPSGASISHLARLDGLNGRSWPRMVERRRSQNVTRSGSGAVPLRAMSHFVTTPLSEPASPAGLQIRILGPLEVRVDGALLVVDTRKASAILALLAVEGRPLAREELAAMLWPESDDESARGALRRTLSVLRAALGDRWLRVDRSSVELDGAWVDLASLEAATSTSDADALRAAADLARGPFLAGFSLRDSPEFDDWRATRAVSVDRSVMGVLDRLASAAEASGDLDGGDRGRAAARRPRLARRARAPAADDVPCAVRGSRRGDPPVPGVRRGAGA